MTRVPPRGIVLGFQPTSYGFGWVAFTGPLALYDWGLHHAKRRKNASCLAKLEKLLARLNPEILVLEAFEGQGTRRSRRVIDLYKAVIALAMEQRIEVAIYSQREIRSSFGGVGARTRQDVAEALVRSFAELRPRLPKARRAWDPPDRRMAIFDAAAAVQAHFQLEASSALRTLVE